MSGFQAHVYCEHGRLETTCEDCAFMRGLERGRVSGKLRREEPAEDKRRKATEDTLVPHPLFSDRYTLVKAGDPLPLGFKPPGRTKTRED